MRPSLLLPFLALPALLIPALIFALLTRPANADPSNLGAPVFESLACGGAIATLKINVPGVEQPTLRLNQKPILLEEGPTWTGPFCVPWKGGEWIGYVESMGNAYEIYRLVNPATLEIEEISYEQSKDIWPW